MTEQPGNSPWSPQAGGTGDRGVDAPTTGIAAVGQGPAGVAPPTPDKSNRLKIVVAVNAVIVLVGAVVIAVLLMTGGDDATNVALVDEANPTTSVNRPKTDTGTDGGPDTTSPDDEPVALAQNDDDGRTDGRTPGGKTTAGGTNGAPVNTVAPVTLPPRTTPPPTQPPAPALPGPDEALGQARSTLTEFMAADTREDIDTAMGYLAPPVEQWVNDDMRNVSAAALRADISDQKSADIALTLASGPTLALGPEPTSDGGWMMKVNYTMHAEGTYVDTSSDTNCVINDQDFVDTLVAAPGGTPRISSHVQISASDNYC